MANIHIKIEDGIKQDLKVIAAKQEKTITELIREWVRQFVLAYKKGKK